MIKLYSLFVLNIIYLFSNLCFAQAPPPPVCPDYNYNYNVARPLYEINFNGAANTYPYISADGLRLYFSQGINSNPFDVIYQNLYVASRTNTTSNFENKQIVSDLFPDSINSSWLTNDELEIYYTSGSISYLNRSGLYHSTRTSITSAFGYPQQVALNGMKYTNNSSTIAGPSLTPDMEELYIYNTVYAGGSPHTYSILRFKRQTDSSFTLVDTLARSLLKKPTAGQLSKDGLRFITSYLDSSTDSLKLCILSRTVLKEIFSATCFNILNGSINKNFNFNWLPSVTADYKTIAFVREYNGSWNSNLLYITTDTSASAGIIPLIKDISYKIQVYPNPTGNHLIFQSDQYLHNTTIIIYNTLGKMVKRIEDINGDIYKINNIGLTGGVYFYRISNKDVNSTGKFLIRTSN